MRIKHWQGYGSVNAKVSFKKNNTATRVKTVDVVVEGNHEYGLNIGLNDNYRLKEWLGKVIKDTDFNNASPYGGNIHYTIDDTYIRKDGLDVEQATYHIGYQY